MSSTSFSTTTSAAVLNPPRNMPSHPTNPSSSSTIPPTPSNLIPLSNPSASSNPIPHSSSPTPSHQPPVTSHHHPSLPLITKTTWKLVPSTSVHQPPSAYRIVTRRSTKLILNQPNRTLVPSNPAIPSALKPATNASNNLINPSSSIASIPPRALPIRSLVDSSSPSNLESTANQVPPSSAVLPLIPIVVDPVSLGSPQTGTQKIQSCSTTASIPITISSSPAPILPPKPAPTAQSNPASLKSSPSTTHRETVSNPNTLKQCLHTNQLVSRPATPSKPNELVIDGVSFVRDTQGKKLVRKTVGQAPSVPPHLLNSSQASKVTPIKASVGGMTYIRTKSGNLVELSALKKFQSQKLQEMKKARLLAAVSAMRSRYNSSSWGPKKTVAPQGRTKINQVSRPPLIKKNEQCRFFAKTGSAFFVSSLSPFCLNLFEPISLPTTTHDPSFQLSTDTRLRLFTSPSTYLYSPQHSHAAPLDLQLGPLTYRVETIRSVFIGYESIPTVLRSRLRQSIDGILSL